MMSNKPSSEFIRFIAHKGSFYKDTITDNMHDIFLQELSRIQTVRMRNKGKKDIDFIKNFDTNGAKFCFLDFLNEYLDEHKKTSKELHEKLDNLEEITAENIINEIRNDQDLKKRAKKVYDKYTDKGKIKEVRNQPVKLLEKVVILLDEVDEDHINRMEQEEKEAYIENIELIQKKLNEIKKLYKK